jgi:hypothetical protein
LRGQMVGKIWAVFSGWDGWLLTIWQGLVIQQRALC